MLSPDQLASQAAKKSGDIASQASKAAERVQETTSDAVSSVSEQASQMSESVSDKASEMADQASQAAEDAREKATAMKDEAIAKGQEMADQANASKEEAIAKAEQMAAEAEQDLQDAQDLAKQKMQEAHAKAEEMKAAALAKAEELASQAPQALDDAKKMGSEKADEFIQKGNELKETYTGKKNQIEELVNQVSKPVRETLPDNAAPDDGSMINRINVQIGSSTIKKFTDLSLSQPFGGHHVLDLQINSEDINEVLGKSAWSQISLKEITQKWAGEKVTVTIMQGETDQSGNLKQKREQTFTGVVTGVQLQMRDAVNTSVSIGGTSPTIVFNSGPNTRSYSEKTLADIVNDVLNPFKGILKSSVSPEFKGVIPYLTQFQEDNYQFLQRLARTYGEWFFYDGDKIVFGKSTRSNTTAASLEYGSNLTQMEYDMKLVPLAFKAQSYDYFSDQKYESPSKDEKVNVQDYTQTAMSKSDSFYNYESLDIEFHGHGKSDTLKKAVKNYKSESSNKLAVLKGTSTSLEVRIGGPIKVKDDIMENGKLKRTDDYGSFIVTNVRHYVDSRGFYQNMFEAIPQDIDYPPVDYHAYQPRAESQPAKVKEVGDEKNMGRVKVQFYWQKEGETTPWIRVASLMSGKNQGVYFVPEVDEVVFVDFEFGNPDLPFVRGSMYHGAVLPGEKLFQKENNYKGIITKGGNHIIIDDSDGKEEIRIYNKDNKNEVVLSMSGKPHIDIKSKGKILFEAEEIEMKAKSITMNADQEWKLETADASINAKSGVKVEGATVSIEGKAKTSVKASGQLALESSGQASLKGAIVMIN